MLSTSSTDRLISSQISGIAAPSNHAPLLLHALPIRGNSYRVYQPTTTATSHTGTRYDRVPSDDTPHRYRTPSSRWRSLLKPFTMAVHSGAGAGDGRLEQNMRQAFAEKPDHKDLDAKHPTIQDQGDDDISFDSGSRIGPQVLAALSVSMGSLVVGFASGYTSPAGPSMLDNSTSSVDITSSDTSLIAGLLPLSALVGGVIGGPLIDIIGRKASILGTAIPFIVSWLLIGLATNVPLILAGRIVMGFCIGLCSLALPVYLGETVQPEVRGTLGLFPTAFGNTGILLVFTAGMFLNWWQLALLGVFIPVPYLILMCIIPETPSWYLLKGRREDAQKSLQWLRGRDADISKEFAEVESCAKKNTGGDSSLKSLFTLSSLRPLAITIGLMFFQQFSGVNAVIFYTVQIFKDTGSTLDGNICTIIVGCVNFASTFLATLVIDRMGRKMLLYVSAVTMTMTLGALGTYMYLKELDDSELDLQRYAYIPLLSFVFYIIGFSLGFGPIPWLMMGEILPAKIRGPAASVATAFNWGCTSVVTLTFNDLKSQLGTAHTFWMFGAICFLSFFFVLFCVPETRGKSLEDIEKKFTKHTRRMSSIANLRPSPMSV